MGPPIGPLIGHLMGPLIGLLVEALGLHVKHKENRSERSENTPGQGNVSHVRDQS